MGTEKVKISQNQMQILVALDILSSPMPLAGPWDLGERRNVSMQPTRKPTADSTAAIPLFPHFSPRRSGKCGNLTPPSSSPGWVSPSVLLEPLLHHLSRAQDTLNTSFQYSRWVFASQLGPEWSDSQDLYHFGNGRSRGTTGF